MTGRSVRPDGRPPASGGNRSARPIAASRPSGRTYRTAAPKADGARQDRAAAWWMQWDLPLLAIVGMLLAFGLVMVFSATYYRAGAYYFQRQLGWVAIGLVVMFVVARAPIGWWPKLAIPMMIVALISLVAVYLFSDERFGSRRTFFGSIQPSEFAKLAVAVYVAAWAASKGRQLADVRGGLIPFAILIGLVASLIAIEPNLSTTLVVLAIGLAIFFMGGADVRQLLVVLAIGAVMFALVIWQSPYALERITRWWNMLADPSMAPENVRRAIELMRRRDG
ncbi:MAG: FtsW/RodA/SpoVE family cell cycle protein, partial [Anaerolineae bacterium]